MAYLKSWMRTIQLGIKSLLLHPMRSMLTVLGIFIGCLLYTSPSPRDATLSRMPSSA